MQILKDNAAPLLLILLLVVGVQFVMLLGLSSRVGRLSRVLRKVMTGPGGEDLEAILKNCLNESQRATGRGDELEAQLQTLGEAMRGCVQRVGIVRFDAYGDVSGQQSFSLALLDGHANGAIITGLFGRNDGRCYGKPVHEGQTEGALSDEENQALQMALGTAASGGRTRALSNGRR